MEKRCFACMNPVESAVCSHCGHNNADPGNFKESLLRPGTMVGGRYYTGLPLEGNGEGVTYIAYDDVEKIRVRLREFFPGTLCHRESDGKTVSVNSGREIQYKALMTDFVELSKQLIGITANNDLLKAKRILADNGTIYTIYEDVRSVSLAKYLADNAGELSWEETENLFLPLLYTVKLLNSNGIVHRGISLENILVTENHLLKLKGICISSVRAINAEVKPELFTGCAAPEQYEKCSSHGEWTDVYAVSAVLYKVLTGTMPPRADIRAAEGELLEPAKLNPRISANVSRAIAKGLSLDRTVRTRTIKDLIGDLYAASPAKTMPPPQRILDEEDDEEDFRRKSSHELRDNRNKSNGRKKKKRHIPIWLIVVLVTLPLMLVIFFLIYDSILGDTEQPVIPPSSSLVVSEPVSSETPSSEPASSEETSSQLPQVLVDNFVGQDYADILNSNSYRDVFVFTAEEVYDDFVAYGEIISQSVEENSVVDKGTEIKLVVSKGSQKMLVPPPYGEGNTMIPLEVYRKVFEDNGVTVYVEQREAPGFNAGDIVGTDPAFGSILDREQTNAITIYVAMAMY